MLGLLISLPHASERYAKRPYFVTSVLCTWGGHIRSYLLECYKRSSISCGKSISVEFADNSEPRGDFQCKFGSLLFLPRKKRRLGGAGIFFYRDFEYQGEKSSQCRNADAARRVEGPAHYDRWTNALDRITFTRMSAGIRLAMRIRMGTYQFSWLQVR